ncbi:MAG: universal stress protein [Serratia marcescens]|nr:universal stress protein [Serratia marcescens]
MTTEFMQVTLSQQPADARWGEKALLSTNGEGMTIHLTGADKLGAIQRAGRKIDGQGIKNVKLAGDGWDLENSWAFWQGYRGPKGQRNVEWAELPEAARQELDKRLKIVDWVRDTINMPAEELGPEQLATRAVDLMCDVGCDAVSYRITKGEDLREQNYAGIHTVGRGSERPPVLLALDFSPTSTRAVQMAGQLGFLDAASLTALHAFEPFAKGMMRYSGIKEDRVEHYVDQEELKANVELRDYVAGLGLGREDIQLRVGEGLPINVIMTEVRRQAPQLTVLGTQGLTGFRRALIGSVAEAALGDLPCDVLAVPPKRD